MLAYWALFAFFAVGAVFDAARPPDMQRLRIGWLFGGALILILIGFRYEVGADWETYERIFSRSGFTSFWRFVDRGDPSYQALNWVIQYLDGEVIWVNVICASLFTWGLFRLAQVQPYPWLAVLVAIPYMVLVASMYTRQAAALGILMAGLSFIVKGGSISRFLIYVAFAATFHRTAIVILPLVVFAKPTNRFITIVGGIAAFYFLYNLFLADSMDAYVSGYIERGYSSQGAAIRVALNLLAAIVFLIRRRDFGFPQTEDRMWFYFAMTSVAAVILLFVSPSSTAVDRLALYLMPLQVVVLSRVPFVFTSRFFGVGLIALYCFAIQFVWLNFANHAEYWLPYQFYPMFE